MECFSLILLCLLFLPLSFNLQEQGINLCVLTQSDKRLIVVFWMKFNWIVHQLKGQATVGRRSGVEMIGSSVLKSARCTQN